MCTGINISREYTYPGDHDTATMFDVCERLLPHRADVVHTMLDGIAFLTLISPTVSTYFTGNQFAAFYRNAIILS